MSGWGDHLERRRKETFCARFLLLPTSWYEHRRQTAFAEKCRFNRSTMGQNSSVFCYTNPWRQSLILKALIKFYIKNILQSGRIMIGTFVFRVFFQWFLIFLQFISYWMLLWNGPWYCYHPENGNCWTDSKRVKTA